MLRLLKRLSRIALIVMLFLGVGEILLRLGQYGRFFQGERHLVVDKNLRDTPELQATRAGTLPMSEGDLRVMVLGDSYIQGGGIKPEATFASRLRALLQGDPRLSGHRVFVLDASAGGSNSYENRRHYFELVDQFRPHVVFLAYNSNDVYAWGAEPAAPAAAGRPAGTEAPAPAAAKATGDPWIRSVRRALFQLEVLKFVLQQTNQQLKLRGIVVPGTEFHHLVRKAYSDGSVPWERSQAPLREMANDSAARGSTLIVYSMPEFNMLQRYEAFDLIDAKLSAFFGSQPVLYIRGAGSFIHQGNTDFALSRYDGHPNATAHEAIAREAYRVIADRVLSLRSR